MSDTKTITERDAVLREREAFMRGMRTSLRSARRGKVEQFPDLPGDEAILEAVARRTYPLPKVERPRVVTDCGDSAHAIIPLRWRVVNGDIEWAYADRPNAAFSRARGATLTYTPERIRLLADLLSNPTELCDAE